jgi:signal transduction histidine kinase
MEIANPNVIFLALESLLYVIIAGAALIRRRFESLTLRWFALYIGVSFLWAAALTVAAVAWPDALSADPKQLVLYYGLPALALSLLLLTRSVLRLEGSVWGWAIAGGVWLIAAIILGANLLNLPDAIVLGPGWSWARRDLVSVSVPMIGWGVFVGGAALLTVRTYRRMSQPLHRNRMTYWAVAIGLFILGTTLAIFGQEALGGSASVLAALVVAYVVTSYQLPDIRQMVRQGGSYLIFALLAVVVYTAGFLLAQYLFQSITGYTPILAGLTLALILVFLFDPILRRVQRLLDRLFSATRYDSAQTLREYSASISNILDLERLATVAVGLIGEAMGVHHGTLFVVHPGGEETFELRAVGGMGPDVPSAQLSAVNPVADYLCRAHQALTQYAVDLQPVFQIAPAEERGWLRSLDMDVYVPIYAKGEWIGLLALGPKTSGDRYFNADLSLLGTLADQTAVALENARLFDDVKARSEEIARLNERLMIANRDLARLDEAKSDFIGVASHELRTPLTNIRGYNDILRGMVKSDTLQAEVALELTDGVNKGVRRLHEIVNTMFDVSRIDTATLDVNPLPTPVEPMVNAALDSVAEALEERKQTVTTDGLAGLPTMIVDNKRLEQAFVQLLQNAIKFTPDGGRIHIAGRLVNPTKPPEEQEVEFTVADDGIGIADEDLERVFDKFFRVGELMLHSTSKYKFKGAGPGLGLTLVKGIVEAHGGRVWAESPGYDEEERPGSVFHIVLPLQAHLSEASGSEEGIAAARAGMEH